MSDTDLAERKLTLQDANHATIVHISDLHFTAGTNFIGTTVEATHWRQLTDAVEASKPDVIVVTGDLVNSPSAAAFRNVRAYLIALCAAARLNPNQALFVVPGNHDYRWAGLGLNFARAPFGRQFGGFMTPCLLRLVADKRPDLELAIYGIDSNGYGGFADGEVTKAELKQCESFLSIERVRAAYSIVLMHHHPTPICKSEDPHGVAIEPTMILKNGGTVMDTLIRSGADLILHGHKHWDGIFQVTRPPAERVVCVVAAGSAGKETGATVKFNRLRIRRSHMATVEILKAMPGNAFSVEADPISLGWYGAIRRQRGGRLAERLRDRFSWGADRLEHRCTINLEGEANCYRAYRNLVPRREGTDFLPITLRSSLAIERPTAPDFESRRGPYTLAWDSAQAGGREVFGIYFRGPDSGARYGDVAFTRVLRGAFKHSIEDKRKAIEARKQLLPALEEARDVDSVNREWWDIHHRDVLARQITMVLTIDEELAKRWLPESVFVHAYDYSGFSEWTEQLALGEFTDADETDHAQACLFRSAVNQYTLVIDRPLPGYRYRLSWLLPESFAPGPAKA